MKTTLIACLLLVAGSGYAQLTKPCSGNGCSDDIDDTDTYNVAKKRYDHNFSHGSKAWQDKYWQLYYKTSAGSNLSERITSPFYTGGGNTDGVAADGNSDFRPTDGWELVYTSLGERKTAQPSTFPARRLCFTTSISR